MDEYLLTLVKPDEEQIWIGKEPPFPMTALDLLQSTNSRAAAMHHTRYRVVWYFRDLLSDAGEFRWRLVLDECLRMIGDAGSLVLRFKQNRYLTAINVKQFVGRRLGIEAAVAHESVADGVFTIVFSVVRKQVALYRDKSWSFVLLSQGDRTESAVAFLASVRAQDPQHQHEIVVVGPERAEYEPYGVTYHSEAYREDLAELARKKNNAVAQIRGANVAIVHDRYVIGDKFLSGFDAFGYDFDLVAVRQTYASGADYPFYAAIDSTELTWAQPIHCTDYDRLLPGQFVNGGFMVFKAHMLRDIGFNNLIFWNQAEDLELTREFMQASIPPRVNIHSLAITSAPANYTIAFRRQKFGLNRVSSSNPAKGILLSTAVSAFSLLPLSLRNKLIEIMKKKGWLYRVKRRLLG